MILLLLGLVALAVLLLLANGFSRAQVRTLKRLAAWVAVLAGVAMACLLLLTGRGLSAVAALFFFAPMAITWWREGGMRPGKRPGGSSGGGGSPGGRSAGGTSGGAMSRAEALEILGLPPEADEAAIQAAYRRLMMTAHPDRGGSTWFAVRLNQARTVLLKK
jgi:DnaJ family protein C protein 19